MNREHSEKKLRTKRNGFKNFKKNGLRKIKASEQGHDDPMDKALIDVIQNMTSPKKLWVQYPSSMAKGTKSWRIELQKEINWY